MDSIYFSIRTLTASYHNVLLRGEFPGDVFTDFAHSVKRKAKNACREDIAQCHSANIFVAERVHQQGNAFDDKDICGR